MLLSAANSRNVLLALADMPGYCCIVNTTADPMHALEGFMKRLLIAAAATVSANQSLPDQARTVSELNKRLAFGRRWSGPREGRRLVPAKVFVLKDNEISLRTQFTCAEIAEMVPHMPYVFAPWSSVSRVFQAWANLYNCVRHAAPAWADLQRLFLLHETFLTTFEASPMVHNLVEGVNVPHMHDVLHFVHQIVLWGRVDNLSLSPFERLHRDLCIAIFDKTDKRVEEVEEVMLRTLRRRELQLLTRRGMATYYAQNPACAPTVKAGRRKLGSAWLPRERPPRRCCAV
jgi:hypothetical protein